METLVINMLGGPCSGKSSSALELTAHLKWNGYNAEYVPEYAKGVVWSKNFNLFDDQIYIFSKQYHHIFRLIGQVNFIVTDCPIILSVIYNKSHPHLNQMMVDEFKKFNNLNFYIERHKPYLQVGRYQTEDEAIKVDTSVLDMLKLNDIPYIAVPGKEGVSEVMNRHIRRAWELLITKEVLKNG